MRDVVSGLSHLGSISVIHRDIKLDNILVKRKTNTAGRDIKEFEFKLGDMGLAKQLCE